MPRKTINDYQHLFFKPEISPLQAIAGNGFIVSSDDHRLISLEKSFLGVKECIYYSDNSYDPPLSSDLWSRREPILIHKYDKKDVFVLNHKEAYDLAQLLFKALTKSNEDAFEYFESSSMNWAAFLFNDLEYSLSEFMSLEKLPEEYLPLTNSFIDSNIFVDLNIVIGVNNGYDVNDGITFYVLIQHRTYSQGSFLNISNFHFSRKNIEEYFRSDKNLDILRPVIGYEVCNKFAQELTEFAENYSFLYGHDFDDIHTAFIPICLDIHNINRSVVSMETDNRLRLSMRKLVEKATWFLSQIGERKDYALLIDFLLSYSEFDLDEIRTNRRRVEEIFVSRRSYKSLITRLTKTLPNPKRHELYLKDQIGSFSNIRHLV